MKTKCDTSTAVNIYIVGKGEIPKQEQNNSSPCNNVFEEVGVRFEHFTIENV